MSKHKEVDMVKDYKMDEARRVVANGKVVAVKLIDEIDGKQIGDTLPEELAASVFVLFQATPEKEVLLKMYADDIQNLVSICAYAGMRYEQQRR